MPTTTHAHLQDKTGCFVNSSDDKELTCGDYETADEYQSNVLEKVHYNYASRAHNIAYMCVDT